MKTEKTQVETNLLSFLDKKLREQTIKYMVQKQMYCSAYNTILDYRSAICVEILNKETNKLIDSKVLSPKILDKLEEIKRNITAKNYNYKIYSIKKDY